MPAAKKQQQEEQQPDSATEDKVQDTVITEESVLPDTEKQEDVLPSETADVDALKLELEKLKAQNEAKEDMTVKERERYEKMVKDTQKSYHEATQKLAELSKNNQQLPPMEKGQTVEEWMKGVLEKYEDDPKAGLELALKGVLGELDSTRYSTLQAVKAAEEKAYRKALEQIPGYKERQERIKELDEQHPELADLPDEKKVVIIEAMTAANKPDPATFAGTTGSGQRVRTGVSDKSKSWLNDPEVQKEARSLGFTSKQELERYASMVVS
jgi:hypothetical protein